MREWPFFKYFFNYIYHSKTRQRLLFIAVVGLFLSSFSLTVIQGVMGGLQNGLIKRSKSIHGFHVIEVADINFVDVNSIKNILRQNKIPYQSELTIEVMLKRKNFVAPARLHGIDLEDTLPVFLKEKDFSGLILGSDLASKLRVQYTDDIQVIAPGVSDSLMGEVPRFLNEGLSDYFYSELMEVDEFELWSRIEFVQNLLRERKINQIRIFADVPEEIKIKILKLGSQNALRWMTWEETNQSLVWSLNLENKVMLFLFISMSFLVAISITSGLLIFYSKISRDLMSFWILGMAQEKLIFLCFRFTLILSGLTCFIGTLSGMAGLKILDKFGHEIMPDIFIERKIPIQLNFSEIGLSFSIPFLIAALFSYFSFSHFRKENQSFVSLVRSVS